MDIKKDKVDHITDELLNITSVEEDNSIEAPTHSRLLTVLRQMDVSSGISAISEEMRESILSDINRRIDKATRRSFIIKVVSAAASVLLLLGITNYISYQQGNQNVNSQIVRMHNPLGMQSSIELSDGTIVTLNAGSTLAYPTKFTGKKREVEIGGEAFFEVKHDDKQPFIVKAENIKVTVLGTKFNVKAYNEEKTIEVTLEEGSLGVGLDNQNDYMKITPGQQILFDKTLQSFERKQVNLNYYTAWKEGKFYFNSMTFENIAKQLERRFNVHIEIASEKLKQIVYTGDFVNQESLEQILRVITADRRSYYHINGDFIRIYNK